MSRGPTLRDWSTCSREQTRAITSRGATRFPSRPCLLEWRTGRCNRGAAPRGCSSPAIGASRGSACTHQLSPWLSDYGHATFMPFAGEAGFEPEARSSSFRPEEAALLPYALRVRLLRYQADVELVPTLRGCVISTAFADAGPRGLMIEIPGQGRRPSSRTLRAKIVRFESRRMREEFQRTSPLITWFSFPSPGRSFDVHASGGNRIAVVKFSGATGRTMDAKIATSFISFNRQCGICIWKPVTARRRNCAARARRSGMRHWAASTLMVRLSNSVGPFIPAFTGRCCSRAPFTSPMRPEILIISARSMARLMPGVMYADHGYWDVYRAWYPLMSLVFPERLGEILQAWVNAYREGGWMPQFPAPGYRACMSGSLIDSFFADAVVKGVKGFDVRRRMRD